MKASDKTPFSRADPDAHDAEDRGDAVKNPLTVAVTRTDPFIEIGIPAKMLESNPPSLTFEWDRP